MAAPTRRSDFIARQLRVIVLVVIGVLLLIYGTYRVGKIFDVFASRYTIITQLESVAGLKEGAPVTLAGQQIGQVEKIEFIPMRLKRNDNNLSVHLKVAERVQSQIRRDSRAAVRSQGLLGDKFVDISPGTMQMAMLKANDTIQAIVAMDMDQFLAQATQMMDSVGLVIGDLREITGTIARGEGTIGKMLHDERLYARMIGTTAELEHVLASINNGNGTLSRLIQDPGMYNRLMSAVTRMDSLGNSLLHGRGSIAQLLRSDSLYNGLVSMSRKGDAAAGNFADIARKLNDPNGSINKFMTDPRLFDEFLKSVIDLQTLLADVRANPKKYVPPVNVKVF
ncbi:MAG TPA: MlaD family protein [Longimicrobiales bacterium]|nr:MlaD family protein [Longimicrobiales bacterium]